MLDTNIVTELIRRPTGRGAQRAREATGALCVSVIVAAELHYGGAKKGSPQLSRKIDDLLSRLPVLPFDRPAADGYGRIRAELETAGCPIGSNDLLIAAHAYALGATMITANVREFNRVRGLNARTGLHSTA